MFIPTIILIVGALVVAGAGYAWGYREGERDRELYPRPPNTGPDLPSE